MVNLQEREWSALRTRPATRNPWLDIVRAVPSQPKTESMDWSLAQKDMLVARVSTPETLELSEFVRKLLDTYLTNPTQERHTVNRPRDVVNSPENIRRRLKNANDHFRRKASEVFNDEAALGLLVDIYQNVVVEISDFDSCENGIPLSKLTAANFCEIGEKVIYITEAGQKFIESIEGA